MFPAGSSSSESQLSGPATLTSLRQVGRGLCACAYRCDKPALILQMSLFEQPFAYHVSLVCFMLHPRRPIGPLNLQPHSGIVVLNLQQVSSLYTVQRCSPQYALFVHVFPLLSTLDTQILGSLVLPALNASSPTLPQIPRPPLPANVSMTDHITHVA